LTSEGVDAVANEAEPVESSRRHGAAVAEWLIHAGADAERFPSEFRAETAGYDLPELKSVLNTTDPASSPTATSARRSGPTSSRTLATVGTGHLYRRRRALERRLWRRWHASFDDGDYEDVS